MTSNHDFIVMDNKNSVTYQPTTSDIGICNPTWSFFVLCRSHFDHKGSHRRDPNAEISNDPDSWDSLTFVIETEFFFQTWWHLDPPNPYVQVQVWPWGVRRHIPPLSQGFVSQIVCKHWAPGFQINSIWIKKCLKVLFCNELPHLKNVPCICIAMSPDHRIHRWSRKRNRMWKSFCEIGKTCGLKKWKVFLIFFKVHRASCAYF